MKTNAKHVAPANTESDSKRCSLSGASTCDNRKADVIKAKLVSIQQTLKPTQTIGLEHDRLIDAQLSAPLEEVLGVVSGEEASLLGIGPAFEVERWDACLKYADTSGRLQYDHDKCQTTM